MTGNHNKSFLSFCKMTLFVLLMIIRFVAFAQSPNKIDVAQINLLLTSARKAMDTSTSQAFIIIGKLKQLSAGFTTDTLTAKVFTEEGYCNFYAGNYKKAASAFDSASMIWKDVNQLNYLKSLNNIGNAFMYNSEYNKALTVFFETLKGSEKINNNKLSGQILNNIGLVYESLEDYDNALSYGKKALAKKIIVNDSLSIANSYGNIGNVFSFKGMADSAIFYQRQSYHINLLIHNNPGMSNAMGNIGNAYMQINNLDSAIAYLKEAITLSEKLGNEENNANFLNHLAKCYLKKNDMVNAKKYILLSNKYVNQITDKEFLQDNYRLMYEYYKKTGDTRQAFDYLQKLTAINDSVFTQKINIQNEKLAIDYEYKQKNLQDRLIFQSQVNDAEKKITANRTRLIMLLLLLLLAASLAIIWYSRSKLLKKQNLIALQNASLQEQKIKELENEKQLLASQAVMKGQEEERSRLAKDLHDGLGGLLTGVKHSIINMKDNFSISSANANSFEKSLNMIDTAMRELRRVAQNMMPEALAKFGLAEALKDYCASSCTDAVKIIFQLYGDNEVHIKSDDEIIIYRIIQELVNNAIKHAEATQIMVQLVKGSDWVTISVEDNGKGFDVNSMNKTTGSGWSNIKSRVNYLKGNIDVKSQSVGTSVNIEIKIPQS